MNIIINIFSMIFDSLIISSVLVGFMGIYYTKFVKKIIPPISDNRHPLDQDGF